MSILQTLWSSRACAGTLRPGLTTAGISRYLQSRSVAGVPLCLIKKDSTHSGMSILTAARCEPTLKIQDVKAYSICPSPHTSILQPSVPLKATTRSKYATDSNKECLISTATPSQLTRVSCIHYDISARPICQKHISTVEISAAAQPCGHIYGKWTDALLLLLS